MSETPAFDVAVVVVSWNDSEELYAAVSSLASARPAVASGRPRVGLTVVVHGPTDARREELLSRWAGATVIFNEENRGFGPAANQGASHAAAPILLFLNPDTRAEGGAFAEIVRGFQMHPEAVALAPRLLDVDGDASRSSRRLAPPGREDQFTFQLRRLPTLPSDARELLLWDHLFPDNAFRRRARYADFDRESSFEIEQAAGAALAVRAEAFRRLGGFSEEFLPAWHEDVDLCARIAALGKIRYWPAARFRHRGGVSLRRLGYERFLPIYYRNALRYRRRHYGRVSRAMYRGLLAAGMLLRLAVLPLRRGDPRPKGQSARAYLGGLRVALGAGRAP